MTRRRAFLLLTLLFSLLFVCLIAAGSHLISVNSRAFGIAAFLFAFAAAMGQIGSLAMYVRCLARDRLNAVQAETAKPPLSGSPKQ